MVNTLKKCLQLKYSMSVTHTQGHGLVRNVSSILLLSNFLSEGHHAKFAEEETEAQGLQATEPKIIL